jgi:Short C-terminal domain
MTDDEPPQRGRKKPDAKFGPIKLYGDRIESRLGSGSIIGATARVDATGSKRLFRDSRQTFLTIEGADISIVMKQSGNYASTTRAARAFAAKVNSPAMRLGPPSEPTAEATPVVDPVEQIRRLGELRDQGLLSPEEFEAKKAELLDRI